MRFFFLLVMCGFMSAEATLAQSFVARTSPEHEPFYRITTKEAETAVAQALQQAGAGERLTATMIAARGQVLLEGEKPMQVEAHNLDFDADARRWSANLVIRTPAEVLTALPANGRYEELLEVPVLTSRLHKGDVIEQSDVEWKDYPASRLRKDTVYDINAIIGKSPRRVVSPGRPIREAELQNPTVIQKGDFVTMLYRTGRLNIRAKGEALNDGAKGDIIRVRNVDSSAAVQAVVVSATEVLVDASSIKERKTP